MRVLKRSHQGTRVSPTRRNQQNTSDISIWLLGVVLLPVIVGGLMSLCNNWVSESPRQAPRARYQFNWGEAMIERNQHLQKWPSFRNDGGVPRRSKLSMHEFRDFYDGKWPVLITDIVPSWGAAYWSKEFLYKFYSQSNLTVIQVSGGLNQKEGTVKSLGEFYKGSWSETSPSKWQYVTDEHFIHNNPQLLRDIGELKYAGGDYFQLLPEEVRPKNAMLLWGSKHSRSNLHIDPYNWTGTLAVLKGRKKIRLFPPSQDENLYLEPHPSGFPLDCPQYMSNIDTWSVDVNEKYPKHKLAWMLEVEQKAGELLIIPQGWAHQAYNLEETIAISSQYMNRYNYRSVLEEIIQCTNISDRLPPDLPLQSPSEQVRNVAKLIPPELVAKAERLNDAMRKMLLGEE